MPKVILVNLPPGPDFDYSSAGAVYPATGILLIASILKNKGFEVQVIDGAVRADYEERLLRAIDKNTVLVGFSVMTSQVSMALRLSESIKARHSGLLVLWGGIHPILFPRQTLANSNIDIIITGEGVVPTLGLVDYLNGQKNLAEIRGIGFKNAENKLVLTEAGEPDDINTLAYFDFDILDDVEVYLSAKNVLAREIATDNNEKIRLMPVLTGLGCCYKCQFCLNVFLKRRYRFRSAQSIINEIKRLQNKYAANTFVFLDEDFLISKKRLLEFLDLIEKEKLKFYWRIWGRVNYFRENYIDRKLVDRLEKNGLRSIAMGAESGSQKILDMIEKQIKVEDIFNSAKMLNGKKINARYSFIVGLEGETKDDTKATYKLCIDLKDVNPKVDIAGPFIYRYYPGSPIFNRIIKNYNIAIPQELDEWKCHLSVGGYLKIGKMPWLWPGFEKKINILNRCVYIYSRFRDGKTIVAKMIGNMMRWRIERFNLSFPIEVYIFYLLGKIRNKIGALKKLRKIKSN